MVLGVVGLGVVLFVVLGIPSAHAASVGLDEHAAVPVEIGIEPDGSSTDEEEEEEVRVADPSPLLAAPRGSTSVFTTESNLRSQNETDPPFRPPIR